MKNKKVLAITFFAQYKLVGVMLVADIVLGKANVDHDQDTKYKSTVG